MSDAVGFWQTAARSRLNANMCSSHRCHIWVFLGSFVLVGCTIQVRSTATPASTAIQSSPTVPAPTAPPTVTTSPTAQPSTATPPAGAIPGRLLLVSQTDMGLDMYSTRSRFLGSEELVQPVDVEHPIRYAMLSSDERYLLVHVFGFDDTTNSEGIYLVDLARPPQGRMLVTVRGFGAMFKGISWAPDGGRFVFSAPPDFELAAGAPDRQLVKVSAKLSRQSTAGLANGLFIFDVAGGSIARLSDSARDEVSPAWSPDGRQIAFAANAPSDEAEGFWHYDLYVHNVATSELTQLTERTGSGAEPNDKPAWSPDGRQIAFISWRTPEHPDLCVIPSAGGVPLCLANLPDGRPDTPLWWSPDGHWTAYSVGEDTRLISMTGDELVSLSGVSVVGWLP